MTETPKGTDTVQEVFTVNGVEFGTQLGIGAAKWLMKKRNKSLMQMVEEYTKIDEKDPDIDLIMDLITALHIHTFYARRKPFDSHAAELAAGSLTFIEMLEVLGRTTPFDFEPKNSPRPPEPAAPGGSTGQQSSTT